ncbi:GNAT family N-acetyltransferase [Abyssisolibacter fermentans]|uniref:GNAT family N-acetyltransferase n=1 Tax=Abyssisolibacter fermentans TaxID=1766203 RepID=UPI0008369998|nr:GNAT family N-acetyltransferase [Abyssisolibacter fermentans]
MTYNNAMYIRNIIDDKNGKEKGIAYIEKLAQLLADSQPDRIDDFRKFWHDWFETKIPGDKITVFILKKEDRDEKTSAVGVVRFWQTPYCNNIWLVEGLEVRKNERRLGIGGDLVQTGIKVLKNIGVKNIFVHINKNNIPSIKFHENLGFMKIADGCNDSYGDFRESLNRYILNL